MKRALNEFFQKFVLLFFCSISVHLLHLRSSAKSASCFLTFRDANSRSFASLRMTATVHLVAALLFLGATARGSNAQGPTSSAAAPEPRRVEGIVMHGEVRGPRPIAGVRVVLYRVGADSAGPLDSMLTDARGR